MCIRDSVNTQVGSIAQQVGTKPSSFEPRVFAMIEALSRNVAVSYTHLSSLNCGGEDFAVACMRANLRYEKNQKREDVKSDHYIISFDPRDGTDNGLTVDRAQELG